MSTRDGQSFFDQLAVDDDVAQLFGRPVVSRSELTDVDIDGFGQNDMRPMTLIEIELTGIEIEPTGIDIEPTGIEIEPTGIEI